MEYYQSLKKISQGNTDISEILQKIYLEIKKANALKEEELKLKEKEQRFTSVFK
ncbi:hypothetical protein NST17_21000 [Caldifermentibacillus hisashii]|uniref:Uncharacterized protein n=1 Tax=Caldifermentibacillus hisashii TaxID=996558 RepID=A0ABU9K3K2_9BACI